MWTQTKQNYGKYVEWMENQNDIAMEEDQASEAGLVPLFLMGWEALILDVMLEFLNTFLVKGAYIYFGHKNKVYVINKKLIVDVSKVCAEGYVEEPKGQVSKSLVIQALQRCRLAHANSFVNQQNAKSLGLPYLLNIFPLHLSFIKRRRYNIFTTKMLLHW